MKKSDLRSGDIVEIRRGDRFIVLLNTREGNRIFNIKTGDYVSLDDYDENLIDKTYFLDGKCDIMKVCSCEYTGDNLRSFGLTSSAHNPEQWTWWRKEKVKKTVYEVCEELCRKLGYDVEIIKE